MTWAVNPGGLQGAPKTKLGALSLSLTRYSGGPGTACSGSKELEEKWKGWLPEKGVSLGASPCHLCCG